MFVMKKLLVLLFALGIICNGTYALDVVYPKTTDVTINSPKTFFIGSSDYSKVLLINGQETTVHPSGGFAKQVNLSYGLNTFELKSGDDKLIYNITRPTPPKNNNKKVSELIEYKDYKYGEITKANTPMRNTPIDGGINRIAHLPEGFQLRLNGEKGNFYRVDIGKNKFGWVAKTSVKQIQNAVNNVEILGTEFENDGEYYIYTFHLTGRTPWEIKENDGLELNLFNITDANDTTYSTHYSKNKLLSGKNLVGYQGYFSGNDFILKVRQPIKYHRRHPLKGIKIALDAGHGGTELGAIGCLGDKEKDINLEYAKELQKELLSRGADVFMTRTEDVNLGLQERVDMTNKENSVIFISIHGNALPDNRDPLDNYGTEIYYYYPQARSLAAYIMYNLLNKTDTTNHGIKQESFAVVRNTNALSLLIEIGYLINPSDNDKILDSTFRKDTVQGIADGIEDFIKAQKETK